MRFNDDTPLAGQLSTKVEARGKWLLVHFSGGRHSGLASADERALAHLPARRALAACAHPHAHRD